MVVATVTLEECVQEPLRVASGQGVLSPFQQVPVPAGHDGIQLVPAVSAGQRLRDHEAEVSERLRNDRLYELQPRPLSIGNQANAELCSVLLADTVSIQGPACVVQQLCSTSWVCLWLIGLEVVGAGLWEEIRGAKSTLKRLCQELAVKGFLNGLAHRQVRQRRPLHVVEHHVVVAHKHGLQGEVGCGVSQTFQPVNGKMEGDIHFTCIQGVCQGIATSVPLDDHNLGTPSGRAIGIVGIGAHLDHIIGEGVHLEGPSVEKVGTVAAVDNKHPLRQHSLHHRVGQLGDDAYYLTASRSHCHRSHCCRSSAVLLVQLCQRVNNMTGRDCDTI
mmetsp:Transcript_58802/g.140180  ORF Transcript_58802/g.140180 Transcript_58802/m.140180 type:complete len:331 (-) Transcript_58802:381-1373(-)